MRNLKSSHDKGSPCLKPRTVSNGSERSLPTLTEQHELLNVILQSRISFAGIPSSVIALYTRSLTGLSNAALKSTKKWCVLSWFSCLFSRVWHSVDGGLARSEAALIRSNHWLGVELQFFTQYARKDLIFDREKSYTPIVGAYRRVSLFQDRAQSTKVPIAGHAFLKPYSIDKLCVLLTNSSPPALNNSAGRPSLIYIYRENRFKKVHFYRQLLT